MSFDITAYVNNITLLYDALPLADIDRNGFRAILRTDQIVVMDTPEMLVMIAPALQVVIQLGDRRIRINDQKSQSADKSEIAALAVRANQLITSPRLTAYGFNFDTVLAWGGTEPTSVFLKRRFLSDVDKLSGLVQGEIQSIAPRIIFTREQVRYDIILEPSDDKRINAHINAHFAGVGLPDEAGLQSAFIAEFNGFIKVLHRLLEE